MFLLACYCIAVMLIIVVHFQFTRWRTYNIIRTFHYTIISHVDYYTLRRSLTLILLHHLLIYSTEMDIGRDLERIECRVTQYSNSDESVMPVEQVLERVSVDMPHAFNFFRNPADVSGNTALNILVIYLALYIWANCWLLEWCKRSLLW